MKKFLFLIFTIVSLVNAERLVAFTKSNVNCMSSCVPYNNDNFCWTGWGSGDWDYCTNTNIVASQFYTSKYKNNKKDLCLSECTTAGYGYYWCFTSEDAKEWDYCSPRDDVTYTDADCLTTCKMNYGKGYYTCSVGNSEDICSLKPTRLQQHGNHPRNFPIGFIRYKAFTDGKKRCKSKCRDSQFCWLGGGLGDWHKCIKSDDVAPLYYTSGYTSNFSFCVSECTKSGYDYNWCYTSEGWDYCSSTAGVSYKGNNCLNDCEYSNSHGYYVCDTVNSEEACSAAPIFYDLPDVQPQTKNGLLRRSFSSKPSSRIVQTILELENRLGRQQITLPGRPTINYTSSVQSSVEIIHSMRTTIRRQDIPAIGTPRPSHPNGLERRMRQLGMLSTDERGHLLAVSIGGPSILLNYVPQNAITNRNRGETPQRFSYWRRTEMIIQNYLNQNNVNHVDWYLFLSYTDNQNRTVYGRPQSFNLYYEINLTNGTNLSSGDENFTNNF